MCGAGAASFWGRTAGAGTLGAEAEEDIAAVSAGRGRVRAATGSEGAWVLDAAGSPLSTSGTKST